MNIGLLRRPDVLMVLISAPAYVATSEVLRTVSPLDLTPLRFLLSAVILGLYFALTWRRLALRKDDAPRVFATLALGYGVYVSLINLGQVSVPAGTTSLLLNTSPIFAFALAYLFLGERSSRKALPGMIIAVAGTLAVTVFGAPTVGFNVNALTILAAALVLAVFLNLQQPLFAKVPPVELVFWGCVVGTAVTLPFARFELAVETWPLSTHSALAGGGIALSGVVLLVRAQTVNRRTPKTMASV